MQCLYKVRCDWDVKQQAKYEAANAVQLGFDLGVDSGKH